MCNENKKGYIDWFENITHYVGSEAFLSEESLMIEKRGREKEEKIKSENKKQAYKKMKGI
ncbi:hypothetical protein [Photobacterium leiognathi]|uniref:hypothetical protein n=1 Tax=Photobacterium leiognathi TaxID=553611 RepID=UPI002732AE30|nr:hypothetical protein [Photobacterium leiognathi]